MSEDTSNLNERIHSPGPDTKDAQIDERLCVFCGEEVDRCACDERAGKSDGSMTLGEYETDAERNA